MMARRMREEKEMERVVSCPFGYVATRGGIVVVVGKSGDGCDEGVMRRKRVVPESVREHGIEEGRGDGAIVL